jgi:senataxin
LTSGCRASANDHRCNYSIQYRMNPDISRLPSQVFYGGRLHDGPNMAQKTKAPWHQMPVFGTYRFFNANGREVKSGRQSLKNPTEVNAVVGLYRGLKAIYGAHDALLGKIGIISPYREQFNALKSAFRSSFGESAFDDIE